MQACRLNFIDEKLVLFEQSKRRWLGLQSSRTVVSNKNGVFDVSIPLKMILRFAEDYKKSSSIVDINLF